MHSAWHEFVQPTTRGWNRRRFLHTVSASALAAGTFNLRDIASLNAADLQRRHKAVIVLWMAGGPSQLETMDPKPNHANGGGTEAIATKVPGIRIAQGWEQTAKIMDRFAVLRSLTNKEGNHRRATYQAHTGYIPSGSVKHPSLGSNIVQQIGAEDLEIPALVSVGKPDGLGAGFLGVKYEPFFVRDPGSPPENTGLNVPVERFTRRNYLLGKLENEFANRGGEAVVASHQEIYQKTSRMIQSPDLKVFDISEEPEPLREQYGSNPFGRGCLLARRLVERGVSYVEVVSNGWDTHVDNFETITSLAGAVDPAMATLVTDLETRGMLDDTLVVWMGEFGRTPRVNPRGGRDHFPRVFNALLAGGGVRGGQVIGASTADGNDIANRPVTIPDLFHSICHSLKVDMNFENMSPLGRPLKIVEGGTVVNELFG